MVWCAFCDVYRTEMLRTGKVDNRVWGQLLISVKPEAQDPAHEVGWRQAGGGAGFPRGVRRINPPRMPASPCKQAGGGVFEHVPHVRS